MIMIAGHSIDIDNLLTLARDKSSDGRIALADELIDLFEDSAENLSAREQALISDILSKIVSDMELTVRKTLSEKVSQSDTAPKLLVQLLANDQADVARPILLKSNMLDDADLISIVRNRAAEHQLAVAQRSKLSEAVSSALADNASETVITILLRNSGAQISSATMEYLVEESRRVDSYQEPLVLRPELGRDLAKRMCMWVSAALREYILAKFKIEPAEVDALLGETIDEIVQDIEEDGQSSSKSAELAEKLHRSGRLTLNLLISVLQEGEIALAVSCLSKLTGLEEPFVKKALFDPWGETLAIMLKALAANKDHLVLIYRLTRNAQPPGRHKNPEHQESILDLFDMTTQSNAGQMVQRWRRNPDYFNAVQNIQASVA